VAFTAPAPLHLPLLGECRRLDIATVGTGTFLRGLSVPTVHEDGEQAAASAVRHLVDQGHQRIGLVLSPHAMPWVFDRRQGYVHGIEAAGLEHDEGMVLWLAGDDAVKSRSIERFIERRRPTALLFASYGVVRHLQPLLRSGRLRVPEDLSIVHFDQCPETQVWLEGLTPTVVEIPVREMGRHLAHLARELADGREVAKVTKLPCEIRPGSSVVPALGGDEPVLGAPAAGTT
jgi:LacI family transcriptional regulator